MRAGECRAHAVREGNGSVGILNPRFFFSEIFLTLEIQPRPHVREAQMTKFIHDVRDGAAHGLVDAAFRDQGFVSHRGRVAAIHVFDRHETVKIAITGIGAFQLVLLDDGVS